MDKCLPKISIITPSYNQGQYLEETILSVIGQNYPNLEYIIIDGGSTDNSFEIIKKYEKHLTYWVSEKDSGQSNAINKGFSKAKGDILGWLNSDDMYLPNALIKAANSLNIDNCEILFGNCLQFSEDLSYVSGSNVQSKYLNFHLPFDTGYIIQPSSFWTKKVWQQTGNLNENLHYTFDWDWFLNSIKLSDLKSTNDYLSLYRIHENHKSGRKDNRRFEEIIEVLRKHRFDKYADLLINAVPIKHKIFYIKYVLNKLRLSKIELSLMKIFFSKIFMNISIKEYPEILLQIRTAKN